MERKGNFDQIVPTQSGETEKRPKMINQKLKEKTRFNPNKITPINKQKQTKLYEKSRARKTDIQVTKQKGDRVEKQNTQKQIFNSSNTRPENPIPLKSILKSAKRNSTKIINKHKVRIIPPKQLTNKESHVKTLNITKEPKLANRPEKPNLPKPNLKDVNITQITNKAAHKPNVRITPAKNLNQMSNIKKIKEDLALIKKNNKICLNSDGWAWMYDKNSFFN